MLVVSVLWIYKTKIQQQPDSSWILFWITALKKLPDIQPDTENSVVRERINEQMGKLFDVNQLLFFLSNK